MNPSLLPRPADFEPWLELARLYPAAGVAAIALLIFVGGGLWVLWVARRVRKKDAE